MLPSGDEFEGTVMLPPHDHEHAISFSRSCSACAGAYEVEQKRLSAMSRMEKISCIDSEGLREKGRSERPTNRRWRAGEENKGEMARGRARERCSRGLYLSLSSISTTYSLMLSIMIASGCNGFSSGLAPEASGSTAT